MSACASVSVYMWTGKVLTEDLHGTLICTREPRLTPVWVGDTAQGRRKCTDLYSGTLSDHYDLNELWVLNFHLEPMKFRIPKIQDLP